ncbi:MAG TPA: hypothetical protein VK217_00045 [Acidimicrobiales bacterium]|nr:hypothetical protein [Acidimicrobiales bacterium]
MALDIGIHLGLERDRQHLARSLPADLVQHRRSVLTRVAFGHYAQHWRSFLAGARTPALFFFGQEGRYAAPSNGWAIHNFRSYLRAHALGIQAIRSPSAAGVDDFLAAFVQRIGIGTIEPSLAQEWHSISDLGSS